MGKKKDDEHRDKLVNALYVWAYRHKKAEILFHAAAELIACGCVPRQEADGLVEATHAAVGRVMAAKVEKP